MPIWLIEYFGAKDLEASFALIALMTLPFWVAMIFFPNAKWVRRCSRPYLIAPLYCSVLFVLFWKAYQSSLLPEPIINATYHSARSFADHPIAFLALFCNFQILNLFLGSMMYQKAMKCGFRAPVELSICYLLGAVALVPFGLRLILRRESLL